MQLLIFVIEERRAWANRCVTSKEQHT